jgi:hypothetical protein
MSMLTKLVWLQVRQSNIKHFFLKHEKTGKKQLFSIPEPKPIPTKNRHLRKKPNPIPTEVKTSRPQGSTLRIIMREAFMSCFSLSKGIHIAIFDETNIHDYVIDPGHSSVSERLILGQGPVPGMRPTLAVWRKGIAVLILCDLTTI